MCSQHYYPPPPGSAPAQAAPPAQQQQQQQFAPPPTSPPANRTQFYPPPPQAQQVPAMNYPPPPQHTPSPHHASHSSMSYPAPPQQQTPSPQHPPPPHQVTPGHYAPPPQQSTPGHYPPPPTSVPAQNYPPPPQQPQQQSQQQQQQQYQQQPTPTPPQSLPQYAPPTGQQANVAVRPAATPEQQHFDPPPPSFQDTGSPYPPEKPKQEPAQQQQQQQQQHQQQSQEQQQPQQQQQQQPGYSMTVSGAPPTGQFQGASATHDDVGTFNGGSYRISHRDSNTILTIQLAMGCPVAAKPGAMIAMSPTVTLKGQLKFSMKKVISGGDISSSTFTGPGELLLGPHMLGDITSLRLSGKEAWSVGHDAYLASTQGVIKDSKRQALSKAIFSGEGLWVYKISGTGLLWLSSFGAIIRKDLVENEKYIVDNGHLIAWNTKYVMERVASGGIISGMASAEGLVCKFTGPGTVYMQTRNARAFSAYMGGQQYQG
ncbi:tryptophan RNA-binding attenuator protein-like domain-containing protein [Dactylonectria estremocensis]|uniref:Altered inheritance of mitochondria protein 24, mitochondrial n=1 Tax=Dactylonectria estremocensis TaxID=1079267 RepID=A0A9P9F1H2_9HYPO|nr:tryptophan RNA-binding attenuator protein-like domain-containing protein [Dactylonectria estremocensis]